jgi:hypothetical protein
MSVWLIQSRAAEPLGLPAIDAGPDRRIVAGRTAQGCLVTLKCDK